MYMYVFMCMCVRVSFSMCVSVCVCVSVVKSFLDILEASVIIVLFTEHDYCEHGISFL